MIDQRKKRLRTEWESGLRLRAFFTKMFCDNTPEGERRFIAFCKKVLFIIVLVAELLILSQHIEAWVLEGAWLTFLVTFISVLTLAGTEIFSLFVMKGGMQRAPFYFIQVFAACVILALTKGFYPAFLYILLFTQFYLDAQDGRAATVILIAAWVFYVVSYATQVYFSFGDFNLFNALREAFGSLALLVLHFFVLQFVLSFYRQYLKLNRTLAELDISKKELEKAYAVVAEVSALEERQRIAKEIHDTAGHSLTTVIMQTETAKRIVDTQPQEAKSKIIAANLQAKTTLERLRECVHLLSGATERVTLKNALEGIIHESTDGTDIRIRSEIEDMVVASAKYRFLCNALREGISNGLRHGNATAFWFELKNIDGKIEFLLSDNGKGLAGEWTLGFGLTMMQERARSFGGEVAFVSDFEEGFEIRMTLPI